jgi:hypothetical protein
MKGKGERGNRDRGFWGKGKEAGGFGQMAIFFLPPLIQIRGGWTERRPARGRGAPAVPPMAATGKWVKIERRPRGIDPRAHLVLGWSVGAAPREGRRLVWLGGGAKGRRRCRARGRE